MLIAVTIIDEGYTNYCVQRLVSILGDLETILKDD